MVTEALEGLVFIAGNLKCDDGEVLDAWVDDLVREMEEQAEKVHAAVEELGDRTDVLLAPAEEKVKESAGTSVSEVRQNLPIISKT